jgi:putative ABC transport system permease protein
VATLVLGRTIERSHELAVRTALGASRLRLIRQLIVEQAVLAAGGALAGLLVAWLALPVLVALIPPEMPRQAEVALDGVVFAAVFAASVLLAVLLALAPLAVAARPRLEPLLRQARSTDTPARRRTLGGLVALQIGLAVVLGIGAGLMLRTLWNLQRVDPGFDAPRVLTFRLQTTSRYRSLDDGLPYFEQVVARVGALPGVTHVGSIQHLPMTGYNWTAVVHPVERPPAPGATPPRAIWRFVGWDYFGAMGIPRRAGRLFTTGDGAGAPPVAIVNEAFARREYGGARAAIGRRLAIQAGRSEREEAEIVGVTGDVRYESLEAAPGAELYRPLAQTYMFPMGVVVRAAGEPGALARSVRDAVLAVDGAVPVADLQPLTALIAGTLGRPRLLALLLGVFAASGLVLSLVGVYGVVAYWVRQREREFGIRLALGAGPSRITRAVLRQGAICAAIGVAAGLPAAFALARLMDAVVFGVSTRDPLTFAALPILLVAAAGAACYLPARRAARVDPVVAMRTD